MEQHFLYYYYDAEEVGSYTLGAYAYYTEAAEAWILLHHHDDGIRGGSSWW